MVGNCDSTAIITTSAAGSADLTLVIPTIDWICKNGYPKNERGETYGPSLKENTDPKAEPDLLLACNREGGQGYIRASDLETNPKTVEEAFAIMSERKFEVDLYLQDGVTCIGTFQIG